MTGEEREVITVSRRETKVNYISPRPRAQHGMDMHGVRGPGRPNLWQSAVPYLPLVPGRHGPTTPLAKKSHDEDEGPARWVEPKQGVPKTAGRAGLSTPGHVSSGCFLSLSPPLSYWNPPCRYLLCIHLQRSGRTLRARSQRRQPHRDRMMDCPSIHPHSMQSCRSRTWPRLDDHWILRRVI